MTNDPAFPIVPRQFHARVTPCGFEKLKQRFFDAAQECQYAHITLMDRLGRAGIHAPWQQPGWNGSRRYLWPRAPRLVLGDLPLTESDLVRTPTDLTRAPGEPCDYVTITSEAYARWSADVHARHVFENSGVLSPDQMVDRDTPSRFYWPENDMEPEYFLSAVSLPLEHSDFEFVPARHLPKQARDMILRYYVHALIDAKHARMPSWWPKADCPWGDAEFNGVWTRRAEKPGCVMVLLSLEHARTGRWTFMRAGRWLTKFAAHLDENEKRALAERLTRASTKHDVETLKLEITSRAERARWAYTRVAHCIENTYQISCMYDTRILDMDPHPAEVFVSDDPRGVFGPDDLGIAILVNTRLALPAARAVVWPAKQTFVCIYGTEPEYAAVLQDRLEAAGYSRAKNFAGAKLRRIHAAHGSLLAPFLDGNMKGVMVEAQSLTVVTEHEDDDGYADVYFNTTTGLVGWRYTR